MNDWVPARDAVKALQGALGGRFAVKSLLADALRDGILSAQAEAVWDASSERLSWKCSENCSRDVTIGRGELKNAQNWQDDLAHWRWPKGNFFITLDVATGLRRYYKDVSFNANKLERLARDSGSNLKRRGSGGRAKNLDGWRDFWFYIIKLADAGQLSKELFNSSDALLADVYKNSKSSLAKATMRPEVVKVWKKFIGYA